MFEAFVEGNELAKPADIPVVFVGVAFNDHFEDLVEERWKVDLFLELKTEITANMAWFYALKDAHEIVED